MKSVIVTGAAGFIGSNMVRYLLTHSDYNIYAIDNFVNGKIVYTNFLNDLIKQNNRIHFFELDYANMMLVDNLLPKEIDAVFHFGAIPSVPFSVDYPGISNLNNVDGTIKLMDYCRTKKVRRFVFSSSSAVYGNCDIFPTNEIVACNPLSPYALQKRTIEEYLRIYSELYNFDSVCLRYFNVYGENQYAENAYATVISAWIKKIVSNSESIRLDGDGTQSRDFSHVSDICQANYIVSQIDTSFNGQFFNVANGVNISLLEIKEILFSIHGCKIPINQQPSRSGDVKKSHADISKISQLGYKPLVSIQDGIKKTYEWYMSKTTDFSSKSH